MSTTARFDEATARARGFLERRLAADATPGMAIVVTDRDRTLWSAHVGVADLAAGRPLHEDDLFELGSIGKSFTALTVLRLVDEGRMALDAPITDLLPWFETAPADEPITIHHLLTHTAGLVSGSLGYPDPRAEVYALRRVAAVAPGRRFHYSNDGYQALGLAIARVTGQPYRDVVTDGILRPLGMDASTASINARIRDRLVVGHAPADDDRPWHAGGRQAPAAWITTDSADGSICATTTDVAAYLRMLLRRGEGPAGRIVSAEGFDRFATPGVVRDASSDDGYGYGVGISADGNVLSHSGGMIGHYANIVVDLGSGIGVGAMVNGYGAPGLVSRHALALFVAAAAGSPLPDDPAVDDPRVIDDAAAFAGQYVGHAGDLAIEADGTGLTIRAEGRSMPLLRATPAAFIVLDDALGVALLEVRTDDGRVVEVHHGVRRYAPADAWPEPEPPPAAPPADLALEGVYRSTNPWLPVLRVAWRRGGLELVYPPSGWSEKLTPDGDGGPRSYRTSDEPDDPERVSFADDIDGRPSCLIAGGFPYYRAGQPVSPWTATAE